MSLSGLVEFSSPEEAQRAMLELNDTEFMGRQVFIREDREEGGRGANSSTIQNNTYHHQNHQHQQHHQPLVMQQQQQHVAPYDRQMAERDRPQRSAQSINPGEGKKIYVGNLSWEVI